jgi:two-component system phosphate regulon sensor histidine kinase PhoR
LQVYWLLSSYRQQRNRFAADTENALVATLVRIQLADGIDLPGMLVSGDSMLQQQLASLSGRGGNGNSQVSSTMTIISRTDRGTVRQTSSERHIINVLNGRQLPAGAVNADPMATEEARRIYLEHFRKDLREELNSRDIQLPYELALVNEYGGIVTATCDTTAFAHIPVQSAGTHTGLGNGILLRAAFPNANIWLLRRMMWLLVVTVVLLLLVAVSFAYLVWHFFRQKRMSDIRNDFMNNMTHELKTPISSVSVAIELLRDQRYPLTEPAREEYLDIAQRELKRLNLLVEKVLKMAAFERSEIRVVPEHFDAAAWLADVTGSFRPMTDAAQAKVSVAVTPPGLQLFADKVHLTNVLQNLLENALKYNDKEQPEIHIAVQGLADKMQLMVTDNGQGIPAAYIDKVFDKFFRVPAGDRHDQKGYGLGLSYVQAVVQLHQGTVRVQSKTGTGSTFIVELPLNPVA